MNFVMKVKIIATIWADVDISPPQVIDSDTIGDYKAELDANMHNEAGDCVKFDGPWEEIEINSVEPYDDGVDDYGEMLDKWVKEYPKQIAKYETESV